jgi:hypothetical protein
MKDGSFSGMTVEHDDDDDDMVVALATPKESPSSNDSWFISSYDMHSLFVVEN